MRNTRYQGQVHLADLAKRDVVGIIANDTDGAHWQTSLRADLSVTDLTDLRGVQRGGGCADSDCRGENQGSIGLRKQKSQG